ncbi:MAG: hypothetical protein IKO36_03395 [Bacteroidaceae bacterium]|nr:hypothetical protein [Bacteroidaceae bacterium]
MKKNSICKREINTFLKSIGTNLTATVDLLNKRNSKQTTLQNLYNKLAKDTIRFIEVMDIADVNGYEIRFVKKGTIEVEDNNNHNNDVISNPIVNIDEIRRLALQILNESMV